MQQKLFLVAFKKHYKNYAILTYTYLFGGVLETPPKIYLLAFKKRYKKLKHGESTPFRWRFLNATKNIFSGVS